MEATCKSCFSLIGIFERFFHFKTTPKLNSCMYRMKLQKSKSSQVGWGWIRRLPKRSTEIFKSWNNFDERTSVAYPEGYIPPFVKHLMASSWHTLECLLTLKIDVFLRKSWLVSRTQESPTSSSNFRRWSKETQEAAVKLRKQRWKTEILWQEGTSKVEAVIDW